MVVALFASLALQAASKPAWLVTEFIDYSAKLRSRPPSRYGLPAANAVAERLAQSDGYRVFPPDVVRQTAERLSIETPIRGWENITRIGQEAFGQSVRNGAFVAGEIVDWRIEKAPGGRRAVVDLRAVAFDLFNGLPINGAREVGRSPVRTLAVSEDRLVAEAIRRAADAMVRTMRATHIPTATVVNTLVRTATINRGSRTGFRAGDSVVLTRGPIQLGSGRIESLTQDQAVLAFEWWPKIGPGDSVSRVFNPPALPAPKRLNPAAGSEGPSSARTANASNVPALRTTSAPRKPPSKPLNWTYRPAGTPAARSRATSGAGG